MDKREAKQIIEKELDAYRAKSYAELVQMVDMVEEVVSYEITTPWGTWYQIEIEAFWDSKPGGAVRVMGSIDDGGWSAFSPLGVDFLRSA
jgi:hypothetical protein